MLDNYDEKALKNGVIYYLNSGFIFNNPIFANFGAQIPIKISLTGDVISNIQTEVTNYGINNALVELYVTIEVSQELISPVTDNEISLEYDVLIASQVINGTVPEFYGGIITEKSTALSIPLE